MGGNNSKESQSTGENKSIMEWQTLLLRPIIKYTEFKDLDLPRDFPKDISHDSIYLIDARSATPELLTICDKLATVKCAFICILKINSHGSVKGISCSYTTNIEESIAFPSTNDLSFTRLIVTFPNLTLLENSLYKENEEDAKHFREHDAIIENVIANERQYHLLSSLNALEKITHNCIRTIPKDILWKFINNKKYTLYYISKPKITNFGFPDAYIGHNGFIYVWLTQDQYNRWPTVRYTEEQIQVIKEEYDAKERQKVFEQILFEPSKNHQENPKEENPKEEGQE